MGFQHDLNAVRNYRKTLLHLTMLTSIVAAAVATATIETPLNSSPSSTQSHIDGVPVPPPPSPIPPTKATSELSPDDEGQLLAKERPAIPFCDDSNERTIGRRLLYVTTLDGRLTALDISKGGKLRWSIATGPGPLISSSIHRLELTNNGQFVRMIPSLSGGIYKFDGESIDPIPITTDNLLSSSAKFSDDLVISGGKETRTYGVSARTGQTLYECSMHGCVNATDGELNRNATTTVDEDDDIIVEDGDKETDDINANGYVREHDPLIDDVIVVRRQTQTVRAIETRTGAERWNFSVGQHELDLIRPAECHERKFSNMDLAILNLDIKVIVPEGVICAFNKLEPTVMLWKYKFDHPIVSAWKIGPADELEAIDMFGSAQWLWNRDDNIFEMPLPTINPSIYVGMYDRQLYIQESVNLRKEILDQSHLYTQLTSETRLPKIPWRPIAASSNSLIIYQHSDEQRITAGGSINSNEIKGNELVPYDEDNFAVAAQSVLNASEYVNGNGFYLYTSEELENNNENDVICDTTTKKELPAIDDKKTDNTTNTNNSSTIDDDLGFSLDDIDAPIKVVILSIWFWWKELAIVAFTSALLLNILISQRNRGERQIVVIERHIPVPSGIEATESSTAALLGPTTNTTHANTNSKSNGNGHRSLSESTSTSGEHFTSRFQSDFDLQRCLGRGGFGVVFEAKNKLDDCSYAIKRITLPNKEESRIRVMREVKTLANCEHQNIVRYFQSWVEKPPPGWQEEEDSKWMANEMSTSIQIDTPSDTHTTFPSLPNNVGNRIDKRKQLQSWMDSVASTACSSDPYCLSGNAAYNDDEDEDSCIIFRTESESLAMRGYDDDDEDSDSCVVFRSESQSRALHATEDDDASGEDDITSKTKLKNKKSSLQKSLNNGAISIDIQTNSLELNLHRNGSNLSDSFQIEFVGSVNGDEQTPVDEDDNDEDVETSETNKTNQINNKKRTPKDLALDISHGENNNNNKPFKPQQNKVYLYIQMQLCRKECLRDWLRDNKREDRQDFIASIFHQIVDAVDYVHYKGLIHRDLKPSNIFFSQEGQIKIGDFGLVTDMADIPNMITKCGDKTGLPSCARHTQQVGTHLYMSPEQLRGLPYDFKVDIYSLGLIFFELLVYFSTEMERIMTLRSLRDGNYPKDFPHEHPNEYELLKIMLSSNPEERPTTTELKVKLNEILKLPDLPGDSEAAALAAAAKRLSRSRTFSSCE
ncbi:pancreatic eIF-2alpha kinase [Cochliomyia hominivorax]